MATSSRSINAIGGNKEAAATGAKRVRSVAILIGSLRRESLTRRLATAMRGLSPPHLTSNEVSIADLPLYDEDLDNTEAPPPWKRFRIKWLERTRSCS